jgi:predicted transcriptional regulator
MNQLHISIPDEVREQLRQLAYKKRTSIAEEIRKAIAEYLSRQNECINKMMGEENNG